MHSWRMKINATTQYLQPTALILLYLLDNVDCGSIYELKTRKSSRLLGFYLQTGLFYFIHPDFYPSGLIRINSANKIHFSLDKIGEN